MTRVLLVLAVSAVMSAPLTAQTPQPFPRPGAPPPSAPARPPQPPPAAPSPVVRATPPPAADPDAPTEAMLGVPIYPTAQFIASYDAGRAQRYYIFGTTAGFAEMVLYYRNVLDERGNLVFEEPPTHMFNVGRFREETMAFPPGVTVKDWTWGGSAGYPNPRPGAEPARFPTIIMIVPAPPGAPR